MTDFGTRIPFDRSELDLSIVDRFNKVVSLIPSGLALTGAGQQWTYERLQRRTDQLAAVIRERAKSGSESVAFLTDHSPDMVLSALSILKAGKAFLCLHPGLPAAAKLEVVEDAAPGLILSSVRHAKEATALANRQGCGLQLLEEIGEFDIAGGGADYIDCRAPAVIFYTSGSTGKPKGIFKSHRTVLHRALVAATDDGVCTSDRQSLLTFCSFASSEADMFGSLLNGASLELFDLVGRGLTDFGAWIDERRITLLHPPVVLFRRYLSSIEGSGMHRSVRLVALAGESVLLSDLQKWRQKFSQTCSLRHRFSSTEAGHIAVARLEACDAVLPDKLPPARPVSDKRLSIVDDDGQPLPFGERGELTVRSEFLSDGYWRRPEDSAQRFTPVAGDAASRSYRTGDLGILRDDGSFSFLGRKDGQVKIRGYRVETGEIENALLLQPGVKEAAVIAEKSLDETRLVAFVVLEDGALFDATTLRRRLLDVLPPWKVPFAFRSQEKMPLTLTGKVDRLLLKDSLRTGAGAERFDARHDAAYEDPTIDTLTRIWQELFARPITSEDANFFDQGGHSLMAVQMMHRIQQHFDLELAPSQLLDSPTIRGLAAVIKNPSRTTADDVILLKPGAAATPLFFVPFANGSALSYLPLCRLLSDRQALYGVEFPRDDELSDQPSFEELAESMVKKLRRHTPRGPYRLCGASFGGVLAYEVARQLQATGEQVSLLAMLDSWPYGSRRPLPVHRRALVHLRNYLPLNPIDVVKRIFKRAGYRSPEAKLSGSAKLRAAAYRAYRPQLYNGVVTLVKAINSMDQFFVLEPNNGWESLCALVDVRTVNSHHLDLLQEPAIAKVAALLEESLDRTAAAEDRHLLSL